MPFQPKFTISVPITRALTAIERTRGFLEAAQLSSAWVAKMQARALVLEAHHTTHIEGTHLNLDQSERLIAGEEMGWVDSEDVKELLNYRKAFDFVAECVLSQGVFTEGLIREIHKRLVEGVRGDSALPGKYRTIQNYVANSVTKEVIYTPPPAYEVPILMGELVDWIQKEQILPPVLVAGIAQFQLVHIHPFLDGNGRTARLLSTLCLYRSGYDFKRLFTISEYYDRNREDYYKAIQSVRNENMDMTKWLTYFTTALEDQMQEIQLKGSLAMKMDILALQHKLSERQTRVLEHLLAREGNFTIHEYEALFPGINRRTLQRDIADLIAKGLILQEGSTRATYYRLNPKKREPSF
ncbi:MAG: Adenosine monophosphate-protein transferase SoFic [Chlamydiae bacterium]|nr:Adenosine monophosphate-protein transferase SoFic [Chlamydiota bacterium]